MYKNFSLYLHCDLFEQNISGITEAQILLHYEFNCTNGAEFDTTHRYARTDGKQFFSFSKDFVDFRDKRENTKSNDPSITWTAVGTNFENQEKDFIKLYLSKKEKNKHNSHRSDL